MDKELISQQEASDFIDNVLNIKVENFDERTGLQFLNTMIERFFEEIPFQNLYLLSNTRLPSFEEIKSNMFNRVGGICFELNMFMGQLLQAFGYHVYMVKGVENGGEDSLPHTFLVAENVENEGDAYCVDVGFGYPMFFAVPIHDLAVGDLDTKGYALGYWAFKFTRETEDRYCLRSFDDSKRPQDVVEFMDNVEMPKHPSWTEEYSFYLKPLSYQEASVIMEPVYTLPLQSYFLVNFHCVTFRGKKALAYKNMALLRERTHDCKLKLQEVFYSLPDLQESIVEHFTAFDEEIVEAALKNLETNQAKSPHLVAKVNKMRKRSICQERAMSFTIHGDISP
ncbi:uncharacterized protein LOC135501122 [Lineus longissimus]|uniref:uncharacterized protein LOC135501122 n=1 Tax=Lineus longissimus TaxID=88925 RepID=UPI00315D9889